MQKSLINQQLTDNKSADSKINFQKIKQQNQGVKSKIRHVQLSQELMDMSLPKKKKLEDNNGSVYLALIADQRQKPHQTVIKKQQKTNKQVQQKFQFMQRKFKPSQKYYQPALIQSKPLTNIENQVKMQQQQLNQKTIPNPIDRQQIQHLYEQSLTPNEYSSLNDEIINQCLIWKCPCGLDVFGPIQYFNHIQVDHKNQTLENIIYKKTLQKMLDNYPNFNLTDLEMIEQAEDINFQKQINKVYLRHQHYFKNSIIKDLSFQRNKGKFSDMAFTFIQNLQLKGQKQKMMVHFFNYLKFYIDQNVGKKQWDQEPPNQLLKYGNHILTFFSIHKLQFKPFRGQDIRQLFYTLSNWMFMNHWTNDRIFYEVDQDNLKEEQEEDYQDEQKKQEE